jgi:exonuclease III
MRVMTWNVWGRFGAWQQREPEILKAPSSVRPDLLALQETWATSETTQAEVFSAALGLHATYPACGCRPTPTLTSSST